LKESHSKHVFSDALMRLRGAGQKWWAYVEHWTFAELYYRLVV
jgi:hypothetical protein